MEYTKIISLKNKLIEDHSLSPTKCKTSAQLIPQLNPIAKYNLFIDQYNLEYNALEFQMIKIPLEKWYRIGYSIEIRKKTYVIIFLIIPLLFHCIQNLAYFLTVSFFLVYCFAILLISIMTLGIFLNGLRIHEKNSNNVNNPFKRMIYHPDLCKSLKVNYEHLNYKIEELELLNLTESQMNQIHCKKVINGRVQFMIYDQGFVELYSAIAWNQFNLIRHVVWLLSSVALAIIYFSCYMQ